MGITWAHIPEEVWLVILAHLSNLRDLPSVARTCRFFNRLAHDRVLWKRINLNDIQWKSHLIPQLAVNFAADERFAWLEHLNCIFVRVVPQVFLRSRLLSLRVGPEIVAADIATIVSACPLLEDVTCYFLQAKQGTKFIVALSDAVNLERVQLQTSPSFPIEESALELLVGRCPKLATFLVPMGKVNHRGWSALSRASRLVTLFISGDPSMNFSDETIVSDLGKLSSGAYFPALTRLKLRAYAHFWKFLGVCELRLDRLSTLDVSCDYGEYITNLAVIASWTGKVVELGIAAGGWNSRTSSPASFPVGAPAIDGSLTARALAEARKLWPSVTKLRHVAVVGSQAQAPLDQLEAFTGITHLGIVCYDLASLQYVASRPHLAAIVDDVYYLSDLKGGDSLSVSDVVHLARAFPRLRQIRAPLKYSDFWEGALGMFRGLPNHEMNVVIDLTGFPHKIPIPTTSVPLRWSVVQDQLTPSICAALHRLRPRCTLAANPKAISGEPLLADSEHLLRLV